jgi:ribosome-associated protein
VSLETLEIARTIVNILEERKGENIVLLDLQGSAIFADYFVICSGTTDRMINGLADALKEEIPSDLISKPRWEGSGQTGWVLVDYGDIIVHLFSSERRDFYRLEELWSDSKVLLHLQ